jgi:opacity protein-like surface antigen
MKSLRILSLIAAVLAIAPVLTAADFGVRAGRYNDADENFVGAELSFDLGSIKVNPNIEYSLADDVTAATGNLDLIWDIINVARVTPYVGAGVGLWYVDSDSGPTQSDIVGNLIGGVSFNLTSIRPYAQVKYFRLLDDDSGDEDDDIALTVGLRF